MEGLLSGPRILLFDIETAPCLGWVWEKWETNVIEFKTQWYILSFAYKWLGEKKIHTHALPDYPAYEKDREDDAGLTRELWRVLDSSDVAIAHNGDRFDTRKANSRFIAHGLVPPRPRKNVDTLKIARRHFNFTSNRLDDLGQYLGVGRKLAHTGKHLWLGCMRGDPAAWRMMVRYNKTDVALLERVYLKLRPWATGHPNLDNFTRANVCPTCQSQKLVHRGFNLTKTGKRQRFQCTDCGAWSSGIKHIREPA